MRIGVPSEIKTDVEHVTLTLRAAQDVAKPGSSP